MFIIVRAMAGNSSNVAVVTTCLDSPTIYVYVRLMAEKKRNHIKEQIHNLHTIFSW